MYIIIIALVISARGKSEKTLQSTSVMKCGEVKHGRDTIILWVCFTASAVRKHWAHQRRWWISVDYQDISELGFIDFSPNFFGSCSGTAAISKSSEEKFQKKKKKERERKVKLLQATQRWVPRLAAKAFAEIWNLSLPKRIPPNWKEQEDTAVEKVEETTIIQIRETFGGDSNDSLST